MDLIWQGHGERLLKESRSAHAQASRRPVTGQPLGPRERSLSRLLSGEWRTPQAPEARLASSDSPPRVRTLSPPRESRSAALPLSLSPSKESMRRLSWRGDVPPRVPYTSHAVHRERQSVVQLVRSGLGLLVGPPLATPTHLGWRAPGLPRSHTLRTKWGATEPRSYPLALRGCAAMPNVHQSRHAKCTPILHYAHAGGRRCSQHRGAEEHDQANAARDARRHASSPKVHSPPRRGAPAVGLPRPPVVILYVKRCVHMTRDRIGAHSE